MASIFSAGQALSATLENRIVSRSARTGVIGLGYVGLPLAVEFARAGFHVTGIDIQPERVQSINRGQSYVQDVPSSALHALVAEGRLRATTDYGAIAELDTVNICVPTPLRKTRDPDMSYIVAVTEDVAQHFQRGTLVVLESTTYPGTTDELVLPMLERKGMRVGQDFYLCFSPERVDPGNTQFQTRNIPKVVGGITPECTRLGALFYAQSIDRVVPVSSTRVAEMVKLLENTFRMVNIGLANEMALLCDRMGIDVWEVTDAAATKPFGFMPFYPGPGLGGHCIPVDPFYLSWKTKQAGMEARFIELAGHINAHMPQYVVDKIQAALNQVRKPVSGSAIHVMGVAYKKDVDDVRESPALDIMHLLHKRGARLSYSDPKVPRLTVDGVHLEAQPAAQCLASSDCVVIVTNHSAFDYAEVAERAPLIVDARNALAGYSSPKIVRI